MYLQKFSDEFIALQREIATGLHKTLEAKLVGVTDEETYIGVVLAHCGIPVDGYFGEKGINALYNRAATELENRRESKHGIIVVRELPKLVQ